MNHRIRNIIKRAQFSSHVRKTINLSLADKRLQRAHIKIFDKLAYSPHDLKSHIENQFEFWMNWSNRGLYIPSLWNDINPSSWRWNLEHITPECSFIYTGVDDQDFVECWSLKNLRPMSAKENILKSSMDRKFKNRIK